jgi:hypothetical protein
VPLGKEIIIKPTQESPDIQYTALSFSRPEQIVFRYWMDGLDTNWQEARYRRIAYFSHLPLGRYVFRVMAANSDGVWSDIQSTVPITVLPPFYLTHWFLTAIFAIALGLIYLFVEFPGEATKGNSTRPAGLFSATDRFAGKRASVHLLQVAR